MRVSLLRSPHLFLFAIFLAYFTFGLFHISQFITADEHYWIYERIPQYWNAVSEGKWEKTFINDKPGISLALVSGVALLAYPQPDTLCIENPDHITICNNERAEKLLFTFRLPLLIFNGLLLLYIFWIMRKIVDEKTALLATLFMALSPILLGITQIINPDTFLWSLSAATLFTFLALLKHRLWRYFFLAGFFLAFSILTKYTASFLLPFFFALSLLHVFFAEEDLSRESLTETMRENMSFFFGVTAVAIVIGFVFLPAAWAKPLVLLNLFIGGGAVHFPLFLLTFPALVLLDIFCLNGRIIHILKRWMKVSRLLSHLQRLLPFILLALLVILFFGRIFFPEWPLFEKVPFDLKDLYSNDKPDALFLPNLFQSFLLEMNPLVFSLTPIVLGFFSLLLVEQCLPKKETEKDVFPDFLRFSLIFFLFAFLGTIIFSEVLATSRYLIILYPVVALLGAEGAVRAFHFLVRRLSPAYSKHTLTLIFFSFIFFFTIYSLFLSAPFYFNYTNSFLPKENIIHHSWGYGGYEAAQYANSLPDAKNLMVWSDYYGFCEFFVGKCIELEYQSAALAPIDYVAVSARGATLYKPDHSRWLKNKNFNAVQAYKSDNPLWELWIDGRPRNFIRVVKQEKKIIVTK